MNDDDTRYSMHDSIRTGGPQPMQPASEPPRFWSQEAYQAFLARIHAIAAPQGGAKIRLDSQWRSDVRWGRNRIVKAGDWRDVSVGIIAYGNLGSNSTNQADLTSVQSMLAWMEYMASQFYGELPGPVPAVLPRDGRAFPSPYLWSETTYNQTDDTRLQIAEQLITGAEASGMLSSGYISVSAQGYVVELPDGRVEYVPLTMTQCSMTVRDPDGSGSGWAGASSYDWGRIDAVKLATTALDKCLASRNPVRIEPGRHTLIMEPQATFDLIKGLMGYHLDGPRPPGGYWEYEKNRKMPNWLFHDPQTSKVSVSQYGGPEMLLSTKIGQRVLDPRITLQWNPNGPNLGRIPFRLGAFGTEVYPIEPVQWVTKGVLTALSYDAGLTVAQMGDQIGDVGSVNGVLDVGAFEMTAGTTTIEEMIASTRRGLLVTRLSEMQCIDLQSCLLTGTTRDGLWLIEDGVIKHPVKNLRWVESPMFAFNNLEQIGAPGPVFVPRDPFAGPQPAMTPPVKVRDFNFIALEDSV